MEKSKKIADPKYWYQSMTNITFYLPRSTKSRYRAIMNKYDKYISQDLLNYIERRIEAEDQLVEKQREEKENAS